MSDDSDFGFGLSSPFSDDDETSTTNAEALIEDGSERVQEQRQQQGGEGKNKVNGKRKGKKIQDVSSLPSLDGGQYKDNSTTTSEASIDDGSERVQEQRRQQGGEGKNKANGKRKGKDIQDVPSLPSLDGEHYKDNSTTTSEASIDGGSEREQEQRRKRGGKNKGNEQRQGKESQDVPSLPLLDGERYKDDSMTTSEALIDDRMEREQQRRRTHGGKNKENGKEDNDDSTTTPEALIVDGSTQGREEDNEHSSTIEGTEEDKDDSSSTQNQSSLDDDDNKSGGDNEYEAVNSDDESEQVRLEEDGNENAEQEDNDNDVGVQQVPEGCSGGTKKRRRFTLQEKLMYLRVVRRKVEKGISLREASKSINISHKQILEWKKQSHKMRSKSNQHAKSLGDGVQSFLSPYNDRLLSFIFEMRETGMAVSVNSVVLKASQLSREFREKSMIARHSAVRRFINVHGFVHRMGTHISQRQPSEMQEIASDFVRVTREKLKLSCRDEAYILNMDQTPVPFSFDPKKTIEVVGRRTIYIRNSMADTKRATCALTVTASGNMLTPLFVFKGNDEWLIVVLRKYYSPFLPFF